jgi:hypothetical protein
MNEHQFNNAVVEYFGETWGGGRWLLSDGRMIFDGNYDHRQIVAITDPDPWHDAITKYNAISLGYGGSGTMDIRILDGYHPTGAQKKVLREFAHTCTELRISFYNEKYHITEEVRYDFEEVNFGLMRLYDPIAYNLSMAYE